MSSRALVVGVIALSAFVSADAWANTPFAGTWRVDPQHTTFELQSTLMLELAHGIYRRTSCAVEDQVAADGALHPLTDDPYYDAMSVSIVDDRTVDIVQQLKGREIWRGRYTIAEDLRSMKLDYRDARAAVPVSGSIAYEREGAPDTGTHSLSGSWKPTKMLDLSESGRTYVFSDKEHGLTMHASDGRSFDVNYGGGNNEPLLGYLEGARVHVGRRTPNTLQINRTQNGTMVDLTFGIVSDDGQEMAFRQLDWQCQARTTLMLRKQATP